MRSIRDPEKRQRILDQLSCDKVDLAILTESWINYKLSNDDQTRSQYRMF